MNDDMKSLIDLLQTRIVDCTKSDNVLLIFDNQEDLEKYKKVYKHIAPNLILRTLDVMQKTSLIGLRYKRFHFVREDEIDA